jgi:hypothetical protein
MLDGGQLQSAAGLRESGVSELKGMEDFGGGAGFVWGMAGGHALRSGAGGGAGVLAGAVAGEGGGAERAIGVVLRGWGALILNPAIPLAKQRVGRYTPECLRLA